MFTQLFISWANGVRWGCQPSTRPTLFHFFQAPQYYVFALFYYVKPHFFTFFYTFLLYYCTFLLHITFLPHFFTYSYTWRPLGARFRLHSAHFYGIFIGRGGRARLQQGRISTHKDAVAALCIDFRLSTGASSATKVSFDFLLVQEDTAHKKKGADAPHSLHFVQFS